MRIPERIGPYAVERRLGSGSFATVWLARDEGLGASVAIKVLAENWAYDDDVKARFVEEARILFQINDERIARVLFVSELDDGRPYFVMEYADRGNLEERMRERAARGVGFSIDEAVSISIEIAECLAVAHSVDVVHRDLKPSNVLFRSVALHRQRRAGPGSAPEQLLLADFGIARRLQAARSYTISAGTPHYMAPEQADPVAAAGTDARADIYSAGVILYELITGAVPFPYDSMAQVIRAQHEPLPPISAQRPGVPFALESSMARALDPDPNGRPATADDWAASLRSVAAQPMSTVVDRPVPRAPVPPVPTVPAVFPAPSMPVGPEASGRRKRRLPIAIGAAVLVTFIAVGGLLVSRKGGDEAGRLSGPAGLGEPTGIALDDVGNLYVSDAALDQVVKITPDGAISIVAGTGASEFSGDGGPASAAALSDPQDVAVDDSNNLYIADQGNSRIRRVAPDGVITTVVNFSGRSDTAMYSLTVHPAGQILLSTRSRVLRFTPDGKSESVVAGTGTLGVSGDGGPATDARIDAAGIVAGSDGSVYIADSGSNLVRKVGTDGVIKTVAGTGSDEFTGDGGPATDAGLSAPSDVALGPDGALYIADTYHVRVRRVVAEVVTTVAGSESDSRSTADNIPALEADLRQPIRVAVDGSGALFILDGDNGRVRKVSGGLITTVA